MAYVRKSKTEKVTAQPAAKAKKRNTKKIEQKLLFPDSDAKPVSVVPSITTTETQHPRAMTGLTTLTASADLPKGYLSISAVRMYQKCAKQFEFRYVEGRKTPPAVAMLEGSAHHLALEHDGRERVAHRTRLRASEMYDIFAEQFTKESKHLDDWEGSTEKQVLERGNDLLTRWHAVSDWLVPTAVEERFEQIIGGVPVLGFIDVLDSKSVYDFKVVGRAKSETDAKNDLQLHLYAHVTGRKHAGFISLVKTATKPESMVNRSEVKVGNDDTAWVGEVVRGVAAGIKTGVFPPTDPSNWWCSQRFCGFWSICRGKKQ